MKIFVTGISSGIGRALCRQLIVAGHSVWGVARRADLLEGLKRELHSEQFVYSVCDVSKKEDCNKTAVEMDSAGFLPDVIVLNAGIEKKDMKEGFSTGTLREVFSVNFFGALKWVELFNGKFLDRGHGKFIAISSIFAERPDIDSVAYCSSKSALSMAFRSLHLHFCRNAIDFVTIHFGPVYTGISSEYRGNAKSRKKAFFIISPEAAANFIIKAMREKRSRRYFPFFTTMPIRMVFFLNDKVFYGISRVFRR